MILLHVDRHGHYLSAKLYVFNSNLMQVNLSTEKLVNLFNRLILVDNTTLKLPKYQPNHVSLTHTLSLELLLPAYRQ